MKFILIVGYEQTAVGPFETCEDAVSYALNVLDSPSYAVHEIQTPISVKNHELLNMVTA